MANDLSESFNESYSVLAKHIRAYVGPKEEAEDFQVDNAYIERGYRINHNTAGRLCKSLCSCHNESVNVWSHIGGVTFFLCILISLCVVVIPNQYWYAGKLSSQFDEQDSADLMVFINGKISQLDTDQVDLAGMSVATDDDQARFDDSITDIMHQIEGISHFTINELYTFSYLSSYVTQMDPTYTQLISQWYDVFVGYNTNLQTQVQRSVDTVRKAKMVNSDLSIKSYVTSRLNFLYERLGQLNQSLTEMRDELKSKVYLKPSDQSMIHNMNEMQNQIAPDFLNAEEILNEVPLWPLLINIFGACFCMGCSAMYHLCYTKSQKAQTTLSRIDYGGISILIFCAALPVLYYAMACVQVSLARTIYTSSLAIVCCICFVVTLVPQFDTAKFRPARGFMYIVLGLGTGLMFFMFMPMDPYITYLKNWVYAVGGYIYIQGAIIYIIRCPERCAPGKFDLCGASHQIFHFAVVGATILMFWESYNLFRRRQVMECPIWEG